MALLQLLTSASHDSLTLQHIALAKLKKQFLEVSGNHTDPREESVIFTCFSFMVKELATNKIRKECLDSTVFNMYRYRRVKGVNKSAPGPKAFKLQSVIATDTNFHNKITLTKEADSKRSFDQRKTSTPLRDGIKPVATEIADPRHRTITRTNILRSHNTQKEIITNNGPMNKENYFPSVLIQPTSTLAESSASLNKTSAFHLGAFTHQQPRLLPSQKNIGEQVNRNFPVSGAGNFNGKNTNVLGHARTKSMANFTGFFDPKLAHQAAKKPVSRTPITSFRNLDTSIKNIVIDKNDSIQQHELIQRTAQPNMVTLPNNRTTPMRHAVSTSVMNSKENSCSRRKNLSIFNGGSRRTLDENHPLHHNFQLEIARHQFSGKEVNEKEQELNTTPETITSNPTETSDLPSMNRSDWRQFGLKSSMANHSIANESVMEEIHLLEMYLKGIGATTN